MNWSKEDADMAGSYAAMLRAAQKARDRARMHGVPLAVFRDGKVVTIPPEEIEDLSPELLKKAGLPSR